MNSELDKLSVNEPSGATITLNVNEINVVLGALQELPHRIADPVIKKVFEQCKAQLG